MIENPDCPLPECVEGRRYALEHPLEWHEHRQQREQWQADRTEAMKAAANAAKRRSLEAGATEAEAARAAVAAGIEAGEQFAVDVPAPTLNGRVTL